MKFYYLLLGGIMGMIQAESQQQSWWKNAVIYEIYIRSFADSNGDGIGDLPGIISKLDYLQELGVDALWLTPFFISPQVDFGYDVADYCAIDPVYGTLEDFDRLVSEAKKRGIRIILDFVPNHTSTQHPWFQESRNSPNSEKRDWYLWHNGKTSPNNWTSIFGGSAWQWDEKAQASYYHFFFIEQADLNWRNIEVRKAMYSTMRFWLRRGIAGFRLDSICSLIKDKELRDNPNSELRPDGTYKQIPRYTMNQPELHEILQEMREVTDEFPECILMGETAGDDSYLSFDGTDEDHIKLLSSYFGQHGDELHLVMDFFFSYINELSAVKFQKQIALWDHNHGYGWPLYLFSNHDSIRHYTRYGDSLHNDAIAKLLATLLLTLRGTVQLYYGEEIGMENWDPQHKEDVKDPVGKFFWPQVEKCRDGERTPMQWDTTQHAGFTTGTPWLPLHPKAQERNVTTQRNNPTSLLNWYKVLIHVRKTLPALQEGNFYFYDTSNPYIVSYIRETPNQSLVVVLNMSDRKQSIYLGRLENIQIILSSSIDFVLLNNNISLEPFQIFIGSFKA